MPGNARHRKCFVLCKKFIELEKQQIVQRGKLKTTETEMHQDTSTVDILVQFSKMWMLLQLMLEQLLYRHRQ